MAIGSRYLAFGLGAAVALQSLAANVINPESAHAGPFFKPRLSAPEAPSNQSPFPTPTPPPLPTPTPTPIPTPTPVHTPTPPPTPTPTRTPTPTPTLPPVPICKVFKLEKYWVGTNPTENEILKPTLLTPPCVQAEVKKAIAICKSYGQVGMQLDDCVVQAYFSQLRGDTIKGPWRPADIYCVKGYCTASTWYIDANCKSIPAPTQLQAQFACNAGLLVIRSTPISLIWEDGYNIEADVKVANFPLAPGSTDRYFEWKASGNAPLLVWDPQHAGAITDSTQLFGEWTFGGKSRASLTESFVMSDEAPAAPTAWRDGFEALASLDADRDGKVSGVELAPLGLWFDANRDGVSQPGEVRTLTATGVTELFYSGGERNAETRSITVPRGYTRSVAGKAQTGAAIDWYAHGGATPMDLLGKRLAVPSVCAGAALPAQAAVLPAQALQPAPAASANRVSVSGGWEWKLTGSEAQPTAVAESSGVFILSERDGGALTGHSFVSAALNREAIDADIVMQAQQLSGTIRAEQGETKVVFQIHSKDGVTVFTDAALTDGGTVLRGTSRALSTGSSQTFTYDWVATRIK